MYVKYNWGRDCTLQRGCRLKMAGDSSFQAANFPNYPNQPNQPTHFSSLLNQPNFFYHSCNIGLSTFVKPRKPAKMRKIFINKWFFLAASFTLSLSILSFAAYKKTDSVCSATNQCPRSVPANVNQNTDMLWDVLSRQLGNFISIH